MYDPSPLLLLIVSGGESSERHCTGEMHPTPSRVDGCPQADKHSGLLLRTLQTAVDWTVYLCVSASQSSITPSIFIPNVGGTSMCSCSTISGLYMLHVRIQARQNPAFLYLLS
eukprot:gene1751-4865_t